MRTNRKIGAAEQQVWPNLKSRSPDERRKSGGSRYSDDSQVARSGGGGVYADVVAWWGLGAYP